MTNIKHISQLLEELHIAVTSLQARTNSVRADEQLSRLTVQVSTALEQLRREYSAQPDRDRRLALHYAISNILLSASDVHVAAPQILKAIGEYLDWAYGGFWYIDEKTNTMECKAIWHHPNAANSAFIRDTLALTFKQGEGLPGIVWSTGAPLWIDDLNTTAKFPRLASGKHIGLKSALAFPIQSGRKILGVLEFCVTERFTPDLAVLNILSVIGNQIGQFIDRQRVQAALTLTQSHLDLILEQMPAAVIIAEAPSGRLLLGNAQVEQIWRHPLLPSSRISDYDMWQGFHLDGRPYAAEEWPLARAVMTGEVVMGEEIVQQRGDGTRGVVRANAAPIHDSKGTIIAGVVVFDDVTAEHQATERVLRLQTISAALSQALTPGQVADVVINQGVTALDAYAGSLVLVTADHSALTMIGVTGYPDFVNDRFTELPLDTNLPLPAAVRQGEPIFIEDVAQAIERFPELASISARTGSGALVAIPLKIEDRVVGAFGLSFQQPRVFEPEDRTFMLTLAGQCALALERARLFAAEREARQRAEDAQRRLAFLAEASQVLASSLDYQTTLAHVARLALPELADWSGMTLIEPDGTLGVITVAHVEAEKEALIHDYLSRYPLDSNAQTGIAQVIRSGRPELVTHLPPDQLDGLPLPPDQIEMLGRIGLGAYICVPLGTREQTLGALSFGASTSRSYTADDLALAEELGRRCAVAIQNARLYHEARQAIRLRDEFLTMASHELRTPLTALLGMSHLLEQRVDQVDGSGDRFTRGIKIIARQATRLKRLIDQMFDLSRVEADHLDLNIQQFDLSPVVARVVEESRILLQRHTIELEHPESLLIDGDEDRLEQVLQNLIYNAIKYSPDGGKISVSVVPHEQSVAIEIADPGIGIPEAAKEHVFKRFYRAGNSARRNISGLGVGLYIVREIIQRHGGTISFSSTEGAGTTFRISLPRRSPPALPLSAHHGQRRRGNTPA
ncbi:MAG TPA: GAF domain-containing protein [Herpetosiphonaceae bacterium]